MSTRVSRPNSFTILSLKIMYYYAKMFGMVYFSISHDNRLIPSKRSHIFSISFRLSCLIAYTFFLSESFALVMQIPQTYIRIMALVQFGSIVVFTVLFLTFQVIRHEQFLDVINRTIDIFNRISTMTNDSKIFGSEFNLMIFGRIVSNIVMLLFDMPRVLSAVKEGELLFMIQIILGYILWFGTLILVDLLCLGYIASCGMYRNIGNHLTELAKRIAKSEKCSMSKFQRMQVLCNFADELDECSEVYSSIYKVTREFHKLFQSNVLFTFYIDLISVIGNIHYNFLAYISGDAINWVLVIVGFARSADFLFLMLVVDLTVRRSKMPKHLNWDSLCSDIECRWDRTVDHFLNQLKFEELKINIYGLFQLDNELCLTVFSVIVTYLTILIQFSMLGYFKSETN